ncbi:MAG: DUF58 domain-containing protein [Deltaproteobacteria bacterium]|nr:DUF58 domain-containing protein [Deltaproteobacteria bacterium]
MPIVPTPRLVALAFVAAAVAVAAGYVEALRVPLGVLDFVILVGAIADAIAVARRRVEIERSVPAIFSIGRPNLVTLTVRNRSARALAATVADDPIGDATVEGMPAEVPLGPHATALVKYELTPTRRGPRTFGAATARHAGPLGLVARRERVDLPADVDVYPDVHAARSLELLRRQGRKDARLGSLRVRGGDTDFERLRPYARGDEPRHVDWRATARRDDLTVRQYQAEADQNVIFALDVGRAMRGRAEGDGLGIVDHAINAALLAADVAVRGGDKAGLVVFDDVPRTWLPPTGGRGGVRKLTRAVYALDADLAATDYRTALGFLRAQVKSRSLVIILTNVLEPRSAKELAAAVRTLMPRHLPLCVLMRDPDIEALATSRVVRDEDLYVRAAAADALTFREDLIRTLRKAGVLVLDESPGDVTPELVKSYLEIKARRLL